jgi:putative protease
VIVQDMGLIRLIQAIYPELEIHGSTQTTVHDESGAQVMLELGVDRVVLARENTLDDIRAIRAAVPSLGLESFVHGALCIAYSGQCFMSGMISERSANRGSCAQSCRKDYVLTDAANGSELDRGYLISARDLAAHDHLPAIADADRPPRRGGRKTSTSPPSRRPTAISDRAERGDDTPACRESAAAGADLQPSSPAYAARRAHYVTRTQPDNHIELGVVVAGRGEFRRVSSPIEWAMGSASKR